VLRLPLEPRPSGIGRKVLEFAIAGRRRIGVEVKAPFRRMRFESGQVYVTDPWDIDHIGAVVTCLGDAHQKFDSTRLNMVVLVRSLDWPIVRSVLRALEEERELAIDAVMIIDSMHDAINPTRRQPGEAFLMHRCSVVRNRWRNPPPNSLWGGWPVYEGPALELGEKLSPIPGRRNKRWVRTPSVTFEGRILVPVPV
jgi:hypothetical protein